MEQKIMISKDTSLVRDGVWVNGIKITSSEDWNKVVEESIPKQIIRDKIQLLEKELELLDKNDKHTLIENDYIISILKEILGEDQ